MTQPNYNMTVEQMVNWYLENESTGFWKNHPDKDGKPYTYETMLESAEYSQSDFDVKFMAILKINMQHGEPLSEAIEITMISFEYAMAVEFMCEMFLEELLSKRFNQSKNARLN